MPLCFFSGALIRDCDPTTLHDACRICTNALTDTGCDVDAVLFLLVKKTYKKKQSIFFFFISNIEFVFKYFFLAKNINVPFKSGEKGTDAVCSADSLLDTQYPQN